ncbi:MAG: DUF2955 domain-containing protein [Pseudomonadota bacterium]
MRFGLGVASVLMVSQLADWPLGYMAALLTAMMLQQPQPTKLRGAIASISIAAALLAAAALWAATFIHYPELFLTTLAIMLYAVFHYAARGGRTAIVLFALIGLLVMPAVVRIRPELASMLVGWLTFNLTVAFAASALWFAILPPSGATTRPKTKKVPEPDEVAWKAAAMLLVVFPLTAWFNIAEGQNTLTLIFTAILVQQLSNAAIGKIGRALIIANAAGGAIALLAYEVLVMAPSFPVFAALATGILLLAGRLIFSGRPISKLAAPATSGFLVLLGGATAPFGNDVDAAFFERISQIGQAVIYVLVAITVLTVLWRSPPERSAEAAPVA